MKHLADLNGPDTGAKRSRKPKAPPPLVLNADNTDLEKDDFYQFLLVKSPRAASVYVCLTFK